MGRGRRSSAKRKKRLLKNIGIAASIVACIALVFGAMGFVVARDNDATCKKAKLEGGVFGCRRDRRYVYDNIYFVVGNTANTPAPYLSETAQKYVLNSSVKENPNIKIFSVSNRNLISFHNNEDIDEKEESKDLITRVNRVKSDLEAAIVREPTSNGAQYYETILRAGQAITSDSESNEKSIIIVIGSGLSDGGVLDFANSSILDEDPEKASELLINKKAIDGDELNGVRILWTGIGSTASPQQELSPEEKTNLKNIYKTVLLDSGAKKVEFYDGISDSGEGAPSIQTNTTVQPTSVSYVCFFCEVQTFENEEFEFEGGNWTIKNEAKISEIAQQLEQDMKHGGKKIVITGYRAMSDCSDSTVNDYSAGGSGVLNRDLPEKRAQEIKKYILAHTGINEANIEAVNGGHGAANECESGTYDNATAQRNRIVTIKVEG